MTLIGILLIVAAMAMVMVEVFFPKSLFALVAVVLAITGIGLMFRDGTWPGVTGIVLAVVLMPGAFIGAVNLLPHVPLGRALIIAQTEEEVAQKLAEEKAERDAAASLVGREGVALTDLRPSGRIEIDGQRYEAVAELTLIDRGERIVVSSADPFRIAVRAADPPG